MTTTPPQQPSPYQGGPQPFPPVAPPQRRGRGGVLVIGLVVGLVVGGGGVGLGWALGGRSPDPTPTPPPQSPATVDALAACAVIHGVALPTNTQAGAEADALAWLGASQLAQAADKLDARYAPLSNELTKVGEALEEFAQSEPSIRNDAQAAQTFCDTTPK